MIEEEIVELSKIYFQKEGSVLTLPSEYLILENKITATII